MNGPYKIILIATMAITLFFTSGCVSTLMLVARDPLWSSSNSYPSLRVAGDSLKHPDILTPLILLDLPLSAALDTVIAAKSRRPKIGQSVSAAPLTKEESAKFIEVAIRKRIKKPVGELTKADLEKVTELGIYNKQLTSVKGLEKLTQLEMLSLRNNKLTDVKGLEKLTKLGELYLSDNKLTDVKGLEKFTQLEELDLGYNKLTDVTGLEKLTKLTRLDLGDNSDLTKAQIAELQKALPKCKIFHNAKK